MAEYFEYDQNYIARDALIEVLKKVRILKWSKKRKLTARDLQIIFVPIIMRQFLGYIPPSTGKKYFSPIGPLTFFFLFFFFDHCTLGWMSFRDDIKSSGKFAIFSFLKIAGVRGSEAHYGKMATKNQNYSLY